MGGEKEKERERRRERKKERERENKKSTVAGQVIFFFLPPEIISF